MSFHALLQTVFFRKFQEKIMATIKEIAALAGVSRGTVDRVLNNRGSVNPDTAKRIQEIADSLDYKPNRAGLVLAAHKKHLKLGVVLFSPDNPFFQDVLQGVRDKAAELSGYNCTVIIRQVPFGVEEQLKALDELMALEVNGIAIAPYNDERIRCRINALADAGIPVVTLNTDIENSKRLAYVGSHYTRSGATAAGLLRLMTQGQVNVGVLIGSTNLLCHTQRVVGFSDALKSYFSSDCAKTNAFPEQTKTLSTTGRICITDIIENHDDDPESYERTSALLEAHPEINALYIAGAGVHGACRSIQDAGLAGQICVITYDLVDTTRTLLEEGIISATICQQPAKQGSKPLDILFSYLSTGELPEEEYHYTAVDIRIRENL